MHVLGQPDHYQAPHVNYANVIVTIITIVVMVLILIIMMIIKPLLQPGASGACDAGPGVCMLEKKKKKDNTVNYYCYYC